jgi:carbonyl reductase 1
MKFALVTGGNKGIGYYITKGLAQTGKFTVFLAARDEHRGIEATKNINNDLKSDHVKFIQLDVTDIESVNSLPQRIFKETSNKPLDVLINNAGYATKGSAFNQEIARTTIGTNYEGVKRLTDNLIKNNAINNQSGRIIVVSSRAGQLGSDPATKLKPLLDIDHLTRQNVQEIADSFIRDTADPDSVESKGWLKNTYKVSKALVNAYVRLLAKEQDKLLVTACCPGWCKTDMGGQNAFRTAEEGADTPVWLATADENEIKSGHFYGERKEIDF